jgi:hypothetical protein
LIVGIWWATRVSAAPKTEPAAVAPSASAATPPPASAAVRPALPPGH